MRAIYAKRRAGRLSLRERRGRNSVSGRIRHCFFSGEPKRGLCGRIPERQVVIMDVLLLLVGCVAIGSAVGIVVLSAIAVAASFRPPRNRRAHRLGQLLVLSHPEWN